MYACTAGPRNLTTQAPDLPWSCNKEQLQTLRLRCEFMTDSSGFDGTICVPKEFAGVHFEKGFGMPGALESAEYLLLAGPMGKYILEGSMHADQQAAVFECWICLESSGRRVSLKSVCSSWSGRCQ